MVDTLSVAQRSERMGRIRGKHSAGEVFIRRLVHGMGYRYRLHVSNLPGKPDLVFRPSKKVIFFHGCFWHRHDCHLGRLPKTKLDFWLSKLEKNRMRDQANRTDLARLGWAQLIIWECELKNEDALRGRIRKFLGE